MNDQDLERLFENTKPHTNKELEAKHKAAAVNAFRQTQQEQTQATKPNRFYRHSWYGAIAASVFLVTGIYLFGSINPRLHIDQTESTSTEKAEQNRVKSQLKRQEQVLVEAQKVAPAPSTDDVDSREIQENKRSLPKSRLPEKSEADLFVASAPEPERVNETKNTGQDVYPLSKTNVNTNSETIQTSTQPSMVIPLNADNDAYEYIQMHINNRQWPSLEAIREQEFINAFTVELDSNMSKSEPVEVSTAYLNTPWRGESQLLFIFIRTHSSSDLVSGEINFHSTVIQSYKLLAYSKSEASRENAGILTLAFELIPTAVHLNKSSILHGVARVSLQIKQDSNKENGLVEKTIPDSNQQSKIQSSDLFFLTAMVSFIELLKTPEGIIDWDFSNIIDLAAESYRNKPSAQKEAYYQLFEKAANIEERPTR